MAKLFVCTFRTLFAALLAVVFLLHSGGAAAQIISSIPGLQYPYFEALDSARNIYVSDGGLIRIINAGGVVRNWLGSDSISGYSGDGGPATAALINGPQGVATDGAGNFYFADQGNSCIRKVDTAGIISTVAGTGGMFGYGGDNGSANLAVLNSPSCIATDRYGNLFISDQHNSRIRKVDAAGIITTIAGIDTAGFSGDGGPATNAAINQPTGIAADTAGNVFFADSYNGRVRKINTAGIISTLAGCDSGADYGDNIAATTERLSIPMGIATDNYGNVFIADQNHEQVRKVNRAGIITNVAGFGIEGFCGDGGPAIYAFLAAPYDVKLDANGDMYIVDQYNFRIRYVANALAVPLLEEPVLQLSLYPNPSYGSFFVNLAGAVTGTVKVTISNAAGQVVQELLCDTNTPIEVRSDVATGVYFVSAYAGTRVATEKILIVR